MKAPDDPAFEVILNAAIDELPPDYVHRMLKDVIITYEDEPGAEQRAAQSLDEHHTLFGLYEGVPRPQRAVMGVGGQPAIPDKITLFKLPLAAACADETELREEVKKTLWHEMAHYFGLEHGRIAELE